MKKTKHKILAGILAAATTLSLCGCNTNQGAGNASTSSTSTSSIASTNSSSTSTSSTTQSESSTPEVKEIVSEDIFSDFDYMGKITNIASSEMSVSMAISNIATVDARMSIKGNKDIVQMTIPKAKIEVEPQVEGAEKLEFTLSDIDVILDAKNQKVFVAENSFKNLMTLSGTDYTYDDAADWIAITATDAEGIEVIPQGILNNSIIEQFTTETLLPAVADKFNALKDALVGEDKHTIVIDTKSTGKIFDALLEMCVDGSMEKIYTKAVEAKLIPPVVEYEEVENQDVVPNKIEVAPEKVIEKLKAALESIKAQTSAEASGADNSIKIKTAVSGTEGNVKADCTITIDVTSKTEESETNVRCTIDITETEGTVDISVPTSTISIEDYQAAVAEAMKSTDESSSETSTNA